MTRFASNLISAFAAVLLATTSFAAVVSVPSDRAAQIAAASIPELA